LANSCHWTLLRICISATSITQLPVGRGFRGLRTVIFPLVRNRPPNNGSNSEIPSLTILSRNLLQYSSTSSSFIRLSNVRDSGVAIIYYSLLYYDCQLGQIHSAKQNLKQAFRIDFNWRLQAF